MYYAMFTVKDGADNMATVTAADLVTDFTAPESTLSFKKNGTAVVTVINDSTSITNTAYELSGTVSDSNFDSTCVATVKVDNATTSTPLTFASGTNNWHPETFAAAQDGKGDTAEGHRHRQSGFPG